MILGKEKEIMVTFLADGHVLLEEIPGVGKTTLAVDFSRAMQLQACPVYTGCASFGPDRFFHLQERRRKVCLSAGQRVLKPSPCR